MDDIVFKYRNKEYGAYILRKKYSRSVLVSLIAGVFIMTIAVIGPYVDARNAVSRHKHVQRQVEISIEKLDKPDEFVAPPPPPPPADVIQQNKYVPPVVVDSVRHEDEAKLMTADEAQTQVKNLDVVEVSKEVREEVQEEKTEEEPFLSVEEMPDPPGGMSSLYKYIAEKTNYPAVARDNNIQGKVFVRFCVTSKGDVDQISIYKGVDPELDAEAIRVVKTFPKFTPGKQMGRPVPVWMIVFINFRLE